jgi:hypothetical protein
VVVTSNHDPKTMGYATPAFRVRFMVVRVE